MLRKRELQLVLCAAAVACGRRFFGAQSFADCGAPRGRSLRQLCLAEEQADGRTGRSGSSLAHRSRRGKAAVASADSQERKGPANPKVALNNLVSKTVRRSLLAGDVVYEVEQTGAREFTAKVRLPGLELKESDHREFSGIGITERGAEHAAAAAALAALDKPPEIAPRYPKPQVAAAWLREQLHDGATVEFDSTMADLLPTIANLPEDLRVSAQYVLEDEDPCRVRLTKDSALQGSWLPEEVRSILVSGRTQGSKLAASMRARLLGEDGGAVYRCLELKMAGKSASRESAIAIKILQRFLPDDVQISFKSRFERFEGYRAQGMVVTVLRS